MTEDTEVRSVPIRPTDSISVAVGVAYFVQNHRFGDLYVDTPLGRSPRLTVSRYYWDLPIPVAVDFVRDLRLGEQELSTKKEYFRALDVRYILVKDAWDGEGAEAALLGYEPEDEQVKAVQDAAKLMVGPRRKAS